MKEILIYTLHKAASTFINAITTNVAERVGINHYSVHSDEYFDAIKTTSWKTFIENPEFTGCYGPIRAGAAEPCIPDKLDSYNIVVHVRDPRDVLTSLFYSKVFSHSRRARGFNPTNAQRKQWEVAGIDNFVLGKIERTKTRFNTILELMERSDHVFLKYEELISDYHSWLEQYLTAFDLEIRENTQYFYNMHKDDFKIDGEDPLRHIRQIKPGDYRRKLSDSTIGTLNHELAEILDKLAYR